MNIDEILRTSVDELAHGVTPPPPDPDGVRARARTTRRRQWVAAAAGTAAVVVGGVAITTGLPDQGATPSVDNPTTSPSVDNPTTSPSTVVQVTALVDARGDMWGEDYPSRQPEPAARIGDFVRVTFRQTDTEVIVKSTFDEVKPPPRGNRFYMDMIMRDQDGTKTYATVEAGRIPINGVATHDRNGMTTLRNNQYRDIDCQVEHTIDYKQNTVLVSFPRECFDNPNYLQFRMFSQYYTNQNYTYSDNPHNTKVRPGAAWTEKVRRK